MPPTVVWGDAGELAAAAHVLGIPHPTGYPLYMLLAKLFDLLPWANTAVRISLLSAVCMAGAAAALAWSAALLTESAPAGLAAGLALAFSRPAWAMAVVPDVHALNALIIAAALAVFVADTRQPRPRTVVWLALLTGLGLAHHRTSLAFTLPLLAATAVRARPPARRALAAAGALLAPLLLYLYLPLRAAAHPATVFADTSHWEAFLGHVMARNYVHLAFSRPLSQVGPMLWMIVQDFGRALTVGGVLLVLMGAVALWRWQRLLSLCLLVSTVVLTMWNLGYDAPDLVTFFVPVWLALGIWLGVGVATAADAVSRMLAKQARWLPVVVTAAALLLVPVSMVQTNWLTCNRHGEWRAYDEQAALLASLPRDAIYITMIDDFILLYLQRVEGRRPDVTMLTRVGLGFDGPEVLKPSLRAVLRDKYGPEAWWGKAEQDRTRATVGLAAELARRTQWRRPVYVRAEMTAPPTGMPVETMWLSHYRIVPASPNRVIPAPSVLPIGELAPGVSLLRFAVKPALAHRRDLLRMRFEFRCTAPLEEAHALDVRLQPPGPLPDREMEQRRLLAYQAWLADARVPLPANAPGQAYAQEVLGAVPTDAPEGEWSVIVGLASTSHPVGQYMVAGRLTVAG
jgi:hypothetical protein